MTALKDDDGNTIVISKDFVRRYGHLFHCQRDKLTIYFTFDENYLRTLQRNG